MGVSAAHAAHHESLPIAFAAIATLESSRFPVNGSRERRIVDVVVAHQNTTGRASPFGRRGLHDNTADSNLDLHVRPFNASFDLGVTIRGVWREESVVDAVDVD